MPHNNDKWIPPSSTEEIIKNFLVPPQYYIRHLVKKNLLPLQSGDVPDTYADVQALIDDVAYKPNTSIEEGIGRFVEWYLGYFKG